MFKPYLILTTSFILGYRTDAFAFDPFTALVSADHAYSVMNKVEEASDVGFALTDLLEELGVDADSEEAEIQSALDRIDSIYSKSRELEWTGRDITESIHGDLTRGKNLTKKIKALRNTIQSSKKIAILMGFRPKAGEKAIRIQEIKINSMMLEELQAIRRAQYLAYLEDKEAKNKREVFLAEILNQKKSKRGKP